MNVTTHGLAEALRELLAAADNSVNPGDGDDIAAMVRFGIADDAAREILAEYDADIAESMNEDPFIKRVKDAKETWNGVVLEGPVPKGYRDWADWLNSSYKGGVVIRALPSTPLQGE